MAEYVTKEQVLDWFRPYGHMDEPIPFETMVSDLRDMPAADVVPVVRCKDCEHRGWVQEPCHGKSVDFCHVWESCIGSIGQCFCSFAERKEGAGNAP